MATGVLIAESLQVDAEFDVHWVLRRLVRAGVTNLSKAQRAAGVAPEWTVLQIELPDANARALADALADRLLRAGWCAEFDTDAETLSVFAGRVFRSEPGDHAARAAACAYGVANGTPLEQLEAWMPRASRRRWRTTPDEPRV